MDDKLIDNWIVIEQDRFVSFGKDNLEDSRLKFVSSNRTREVLAGVDCVLLSAVMQYIENIEELFELIINSGVFMSF